MFINKDSRTKVTKKKKKIMSFKFKYKEGIYFKFSYNLEPITKLFRKYIYIIYKYILKIYIHKYIQKIRLILRSK